MGAERTSQAAAAAEQLCAALWQAVHEQLRVGETEQAARLGERIAEVARSLAMLAQLEPDRPSPGGGAPGGGELLGGAEPASMAPAGGDARSGDSGEPGGAVLVDEREDADVEPIAIHDARRGEGSPPWSAAVQRRLDRHLDDRRPFAILLLELLDAERLRLAQSPEAAERQLREVEAALLEQLRPADALVREHDGRYWLTAPETDASAARALALRLAAAARRSASHRGTPLELAVGIACCPEHGMEAAALIGHAEVDLYAAQAGGHVVSHPDDDPAA